MRIFPTVALAVALVLPIAPVLPLIGCSGTLNTVGILTPTNITEAQNIVGGLARVYADLRQDLPLVIPAGSAMDTDIQAALNGATAAVNNLSTLAPAGANASALQVVSTAATDILDLLAVALPAAGVPAEVMLGLQAAQLLLPDLIGLTQVIAPTTAAPTAAMAVLPKRFANPALTRDAAMSTLEALR